MKKVLLAILAIGILITIRYGLEVKAIQARFPAGLTMAARIRKKTRGANRGC